MAAGVGQLIQVNDFNSIRTKINNVMGTGTDGYGQALSSADATSGSTQTATFWNNLRIDIAKCRGHQTGSNELLNLSEPVNTTPGAGQVQIISEAVRSQYDTMADACATNKRVVAAGQGSVESITNGVGTRSTNWRVKITHSVTTAFTSALAARYFFNAGGQIRFSGTRVGTAATTKDTNWTNLLEQQGTIYMDYTGTGQAIAGTPTNSLGTTTSIGFFDLTTTDQQIYIKNATAGTYAENNYRILARLNTAFGSGTEPTSVIFTIEFNDADTGDQQGGYLPGPAVDEFVTGTLTSTVSMFRPSGSNVSVTGPTIASPTFSGS